MNIRFFQLGNQPGFAVENALCSADPHPYFARRVSAQHRSILNQNDLRSVACRGDRGKGSGKSSADNAKITGQKFMLQFRIHLSTPYFGFILILPYLIEFYHI